MEERKLLEHWQKIALILIIYDIIVVNLAYGLTLFLRFDMHFSEIPKHYLDAWVHFMPIYTIFCFIIFWILKLYNSVWRFASYPEFERVLISSVITCVFHIVFITILFERMPITYYFFGSLLQFMAVLGIRFSYRFVLLLRKRQSVKTRIMLIGAGSAGQMILKDINKAPEINGKVVCVVDDNPNKWKRYIEGVPIVGGRDCILESAHNYNIDKIFLAIPSATAEQKRDIINICNEAGCEIKSLPGMYQLASGQVSVNSMKNVSVEDLLGREPIKADMTGVFRFINGKTVMVTGGGGSIGSELCRQVAAHNPKQLIIFDIYENNAYDIQLELKEKYPELNLVTLIGSVRDSRRIFQVFRDYHPQIVYHAAAHKHVPLMEDSPNEAIKNNAIGTYKTAYAAMVNRCERFVLISTDKAVNPTNIMGASKRLCEMIIQSFDAKIKSKQAGEVPQLFTHDGYENADKDGTGEVFENIKTEFVAVRFGVGEILGQTALRPQKYWISSNSCTPFVLFKNYFYSNSIEEKHGLSIPCINPMFSKIILVSTKMLLKYLRFARALGNLIQLKFRGLFVLIGASKYSPYFDDGLLPTLI